MDQTKIKRIIQISIVIIILALLGYVLGLYFNASFLQNNNIFSTKTSLEITSNVEDIKVIFDQDLDFSQEDHHIDWNEALLAPITVNNIDSINLMPGKTKISAYKPGYNIEEQVIQIEAGKHNKIEVYLYQDLQLTFNKTNTSKTSESIIDFKWADENSFLYSDGDAIYLGSTNEASNDYFIVSEYTHQDLKFITETEAIVRLQNGSYNLFNIGGITSDLNFRPAYIANDENNIYFSEGASIIKYNLDSNIEENITALEGITNLVYNNRSNLIATIVNGEQASLLKINTETKEKEIIYSTNTNITLPSTNDLGNIAFTTKELIIAITPSGKELLNLSLTNEDIFKTESSRTVWLNNNELLVFEKQSEIPQLDRIYLVRLNAETIKKEFLVVSASMPNRIDYNSKIEVNTVGDKILVKENNGHLFVINVARGVDFKGNKTVNTN